MCPAGTTYSTSQSSQCLFARFPGRALKIVDRLHILRCYQPRQPCRKLLPVRCEQRLRTANRRILWLRYWHGSLAERNMHVLHFLPHSVPTRTVWSLL